MMTEVMSGSIFQIRAIYTELKLQVMEATIYKDKN